MLNIKSMAFDDLVKLKAKLDAEIEMRAGRERARLIDAIGKLRSLSTEKSTRTNSLKGKKLPPLYRNPKDRTETWAGRGHRPRWLVAALKGGKKLQAFAIK